MKIYITMPKQHSLKLNNIYFRRKENKLTIEKITISKVLLMNMLNFIVAKF